MKVTFYTKTSGRSPVWDYIRSVPADERARILEALTQIEQRGFDVVRMEFRRIDGKLWEIKISKHRVLYVIVDGDEMVLLHVYTKKSQKMPAKELDVAKVRMKEVLS